ncbi:hypothetical protein [Pseudomonas rubra]|uniref:Uncharacterized protein n=1 Tax=Pseudomonas rubra TaxID=2942627 RepID=A0ABT5P770_9PSED|nr:hypothetical protein [Pseudomonas rubra]MDD1013879.1 hypothetical protein [Pseudomonas rubra]MDD1038300.1 hypothetical protein [Pseudomonas rubra]MDD1154610.1 hypothetical protein [Pseudomonas rubra]
MTIYNLTNFTSAKVANNILGAMQEALKTGLAQYVTNRRGRVWLRVDIKRDDRDRLYFQFLTDTMQEVGHHLLKAALFHWSREDEREFSGLNAALYRLAKHPLDAILDAREAAQTRKAAPLALKVWNWLKSTVLPSDDLERNPNAQFMH